MLPNILESYYPQWPRVSLYPQQQHYTRPQVGINSAFFLFFLHKIVPYFKIIVFSTRIMLVLLAVTFVRFGEDFKFVSFM